jgi:hypothetical protein
MHLHGRIPADSSPTNERHSRTKYDSGLAADGSDQIGACRRRWACWTGVYACDSSRVEGCEVLMRRKTLVAMVVPLRLEITNLIDVCEHCRIHDDLWWTLAWSF